MWGFPWNTQQGAMNKEVKMDELYREKNLFQREKPKIL